MQAKPQPDWLAIHPEYQRITPRQRDEAYAQYLINVQHFHEDSLRWKRQGVEVRSHPFPK